MYKLLLFSSFLVFKECLIKVHISKKIMENENVFLMICEITSCFKF